MPQALPQSPPAHSRQRAPIAWRAYAQLMRLPNMLTACADIGVGALATARVADDLGWIAFASLMVASASLYGAGMVWNDYFDFDEDRRDRPFRPLPSGRIAPASAAKLGCALMAAGILAAFAAGILAGGRWLPSVLAVILIVAIFTYDSWLKRTWLGPVGMGACRFLNILLGFSLVPGGMALGILPAVVVGVYIVGVTWFARTEATTSNSVMLTCAAGMMLVALLLALPLPLAVPAGESSILFPYLLVALGFWLALPVQRAITRPNPGNVQRAVKTAIFGLVILDATLACALTGTIGLVLSVLLLPAFILGRWLYST